MSGYIAKQSTEGAAGSATEAKQDVQIAIEQTISNNTNGTTASLNYAGHSQAEYGSFAVTELINANSILGHIDSDLVDPGSNRSVAIIANDSDQHLANIESSNSAMQAELPNITDSLNDPASGLSEAQLSKLIADRLIDGTTSAAYLLKSILTINTSLATQSGQTTTNNLLGLISPNVALNANGSNGTLSTTLTAANTTNATVVKGTPGNVYAIQAFGLTSTVCFLKIYNKATAPTSSDTPVLVYPIPANTQGAGFCLEIRASIAFTNGISFRICAGIANSDNTAVPASSVVVNFNYL